MTTTIPSVGTCQPDELKHRALQGDPAVIEDLIACFQTDIVSFLRQRCGNSNDADDAMQDTFESMIKYLEGYRGESSIKNWLYRLASTACFRMRRGQKNDPKKHTQLDSAKTDKLAHSNQEVESMLEAKLMPIADAIQQLNPVDRKVLWLRDGEGMSTEETAQELDLTVSAVKSRLHRARKELRTYLEQ